MPNWVEQDLHVIGPKHEIDRFIRTVSNARDDASIRTR
jgi:hypothetical protein